MAIKEDFKVWSRVEVPFLDDEGSVEGYEEVAVCWTTHAIQRAEERSIETYEAEEVVASKHHLLEQKMNRKIALVANNQQLAFVGHLEMAEDGDVLFVIRTTIRMAGKFGYRKIYFDEDTIVL